MARSRRKMRAAYFSFYLITPRSKNACLQGHFCEAVNTAGAHSRTRRLRRQTLSSKAFLRILYHTCSKKPIALCAQIRILSACFRSFWELWRKKQRKAEARLLAFAVLGNGLEWRAAHKAALGGHELHHRIAKRSSRKNCAKRSAIMNG